MSPKYSDSFNSNEECGRAFFDIAFAAEPGPTAHYSTERVEMFPVLADLARYFDIQADSPPN